MPKTLFCMIFLLVPVVVGILPWCRRRNVGVLTWALRIVPLAAIPVGVCFIWLVYGRIWIISLCFLALFQKSALLGIAAMLPLLAVCVMIVKWSGWRLPMPSNRWLRGCWRGVYACFSVAFAIFFLIVAAGACMGIFFAYEYRTIDCSFATNGEMSGSSIRAARFSKCIPPTVTDIHYYSEAKFGECTERLTCRCEEADLVRYAAEHSYSLATNSFTMLDYYISEQGGSHVYEQMAEDSETQRRLVFGDKPLPDRYISLTRSHAFDGGAVGGSWRVILVLDRDTNKLTAYHKDNCL